MKKLFPLLMVILFLLAACAKKELVPQPEEPQKEQKEDPGEDPTEDPSEDPEEDPSEDPEDEPQQPETPRVREGRIPTIEITVPKNDYQRLISFSKDTYISGTIVFSDPDKWYTDTTQVSVSFQMKGRGNTSWNNPKKPFRLKLDQKRGVFGMKPNKDWVLIANYNDKSLLRNTLGYKVSRICKMAWTPKVRACDVYINGSYEGSYLVVQHKEVAGEKVDIDVAAGDYYIEVETAECDFRIASSGPPIHFKDPTWADMGKTRQSEIDNYLTQWWNAVQADNFTKVFELMDTSSFVNYFIIEELAKNIDGNFRKSTFMTKERDKKLILYHIWDFDIAFGNCDYMHSEFRPDSNGIYGDDPTGWYVKVVDERARSNGLYQHLFKDPGFVEAVKTQWNKVYPELSELPAWLEEEARINRDSYDRNFTRWKILGQYVWPNPYPVPSDYDGELSSLSNFLTKRLLWMNTAINQL